MLQSFFPVWFRLRLSDCYKHDQATGKHVLSVSKESIVKSVAVLSAHQVRGTTESPQRNRPRSTRRMPSVAMAVGSGVMPKVSISPRTSQSGGDQRIQEHRECRDREPSPARIRAEPK